MAIPGVCKIGEQMNKKNFHSKNEYLYCSIRKDTIINQIYHVVCEKKKDWCKFLFVSTCYPKVDL